MDDLDKSHAGVVVDDIASDFGVLDFLRVHDLDSSSVNNSCAQPVDTA